jgi:hypothetical protein
MQQVGAYLFTDSSNIETIDFSSLEKGIYFIKLNNTYWNKIVKSGF